MLARVRARVRLHFSAAMTGDHNICDLFIDVTGVFMKESGVLRMSGSRESESAPSQQAVSVSSENR